jgi:dTDP-4-amino-4,6-dideoxygalactose transaminase
LVTRTGGLAERAAFLRNYGQSVRYHHPELGMNSRLDEMQAAMLAERLKWLQPFTKQRRYIAAVYRAGITNPLVRQLAVPEEPAAHVYHLYVVICPQRDALQAHLHTEGIQALIHYPVPVHEQIPCQDLHIDPQGLKASEQHAAQCLSLPCHPQMTDGDIAQVITAVNSFRVA